MWCVRSAGRPHARMHVCHTRPCGRAPERGRLLLGLTVVARGPPDAVLALTVPAPRLAAHAHEGTACVASEAPRAELLPPVASFACPVHQRTPSTSVSVGSQ